MTCTRDRGYPKLFPDADASPVRSTRDAGRAHRGAYVVVLDSVSRSVSLRTHGSPRSSRSANFLLAPSIIKMIIPDRIDFNQLAKPSNLQNSAVLRMLEEEEARQRGGQPNLKRVAWPPPPEDQDFDFVEQGPVQAKPQQEHYDRANQRSQNVPQTFEAPPSTITLRPEPPISQVPAPVYQAQPAATRAPTSGNMRGDLKWPPPAVKAQTEAENRARMELAKGPACRPRRVNKDYSGFFAQHALNSTYPGYRAPPGTQYFTPSYQQ